MKKIVLIGLVFIALLSACSSKDKIENLSVGEIYNNICGSDSINNSRFVTVKNQMENIIDQISSRANRGEYKLVADEENDVIALSVQYDGVTSSIYLTYDEDKHSNIERSLSNASSIWFQGLTDYFDITEDRYKLYSVNDENGVILMVAINEDIIYDIWRQSTSDTALKEIS